MMVGSIRRSGAALLVLALAAAAPSSAQENGAAVRGSVTDATGDPVPSASVRLTREGRGVAEAITAADGSFGLSHLPGGGYTLRVEAVGFAPEERSLTVAAGAEVRVDVRLAVAPFDVEGMVVSAARTSAPLATLPGAITVLGEGQIAQQAAVSPAMGDVLSQLVPGLSAGTGSMSIYGQSFRGRNVAVLIDGVPQSTSRNVLRDFATIDPALVERVEVLRGATSLYGDGATGGVVNIITRRPSADALSLTSSLTVETAPARLEDGTGTSLSQTVSGRRGPLDFTLTAARTRTGAFFDGEGDRIPPDPNGQGGLAEFSATSVLARLGATFGERRAELSVNRFDGEQDTEWTTDPSVNQDPAGTRKARALRGLSLAENQGSENLNVSLGFHDGAFAGGELRARGYHRDYTTRFSPWDGRSYIGVIAQSYVASEKSGGRVELERRLAAAGEPTLVVGLDGVTERTFQAVGVMDPTTYESSGGMVFEKSGEAMWVPPIDSRAIAGFVQVGWTPADRLSLRGGVRHERVRMDVDDFTTIVGDPIEGGRLDYAPVLWNLGAVFQATDLLSVFGAYSQGFSLADIGRVLRGAPAGFSLGSQQLDAQLVDHYEIGARAAWGSGLVSASSFYNESDLGTRLDADLNVVRAPEKVWGLELSADARVPRDLRAGGSLTWTEGDSYFAAEDAWKALNGYRVQPLKLTLFGEHRTLPGWTNRVQLLHSGDRDRAFEDQVGYGQNPVEGYTVADWLSQVRLGPGTLDVGVRNLLDAQYLPVVSQLELSGNATRAAARGRTVSVGYTVRY